MLLISRKGNLAWFVLIEPTPNFLKLQAVMVGFDSLEKSPTFAWNTHCMYITGRSLTIQHVFFFRHHSNFEMNLTSSKDIDGNTSNSKHPRQKSTVEISIGAT